MSGVSSWLQRMRKAELIELAESVKLPNIDGLKKTEIEVALDDYLTRNSSTYREQPRFSPFYRKRSESSPIKKEANSLLNEATTNLRSVKRRVTKAAEELLATDESDSEALTTRARTAIARTPRAVSGVASGIQSYASTVPLPPSPAVVADAIDRRTVALRSRLSDVYQDSGIIEKAQEARETFSSVVTVQAIIVLFELYNLRKEVLVDRYAFTIPAIKYLTSREYPVNIPDLFLLLTSSFWNPVMLWAFTSLLIPLFVSYFINLTHKPARGRGHISHFNYEFDPLAFNIVKALLVFIVFGQDKTFGFIDLESVARINSAIYGGYKGVLTGTAIGGLVTLYEAIVKK